MDIWLISIVSKPIKVVVVFIVIVFNKGRWVKKNLWSKINPCQKNFKPKNIQSKKLWVKKVGSKKDLAQKNAVRKIKVKRI